MFKNIQNVVFDIDGTLVNTKKVSEPAFEMVLHQLKEEGFDIGSHTSDEIMNYIGYTIDEIFSNLFKTNDEKLINRSIEYLNHYEEVVMNKIDNIYFDGVLETLKTLKENGKTIHLLSNCQVPYMKTVLSKGINEFVDHPYCAEMFNWKQKDEVLKWMMEKHGGSFIMIGDRHKDIEAAHANNAPAIGCSYGYGDEEIKDADVIVHDIKDVLKILI